MGDVIYLPSAMRGDRPLNQQSGLTLNEVERLEAIRDNVEALLNMVAGIRRDPEAVALCRGAVRAHADVLSAWGGPPPCLLPTGVSTQPKWPRICQKAEPVPGFVPLMACQDIAR